jgi:hypothetical protein
MPSDEIAKHWLLNLAIDHPAWLSLIFPTVATQALNVHAVPDFAAEDYARCMLGLFDSGMIRLSTSRVGSEQEPDYIRERAAVLAVLDHFLGLPRDVKVRFELTDLGGEAWEKIAEPGWDHVLFELRDDACGEITSPDKDLLMAWMGWYSQINESKILLDTVHWETHEDFRILYWKRLPLVHRVSFDIEAAEKQWPIFQPQWYRDWWSASLRWYKQPWELPGWVE